MNAERWVDDRLATLGRDDAWRPDVNGGLARLAERNRTHIGPVRKLMLVTAAVSVVVLGSMAFPAPRALAQRCLQCFALAPIAGELDAAASRKKAQDFTLADASGKKIRLSSLKGKVVVLDFWATWCHGCKEEIPWFMEFEKRYKDRGLAVLGVSLDEDGWKAVKPFLETTKINYRIVLGGEDIAKLYDVEAMPQTVLIDRQGRIATTHVGVVDKDSCEKEIQQLLAAR